MATTSRYNTLEFCPIIPLEFLWVLSEFEYSEAGIPVGMSFRSDSDDSDQNPFRISLIIYSHFLSSTEPKFRQESDQIPVRIADSGRNPLEDVGECKDLLASLE